MATALIDAGSAFATGMVLLAGVFAAGAVINGFAARHRELRGDHLVLALVCAAACAYLVLEVSLYRSHAMAEHALLRRWEQVAAAPFSLGYPIFLAGIAGVSRRWIAAASIAMTGTALVAAACLPAGLWLARIDSLREFRLPWGEILMFARGPDSPWKFLSLANWCLISGFGIWSALRLRRDPAAVGVPALLAGNAFFFVALIHDSLLDAGLIRGVFLSELVIPVLAGAMWWRVATVRQRRIDAWQDLFARAGDAILVQDAAAGRVVDANDAACALLARPRSGIIGVSLQEALGVGDLGEVLAAARRSGATIVERDCRGAGGQAFPAEIALRLTRGEGPERVVASLRDLSQRRRYEQAVVENERRLRQVLERCPIPVVEAEPDGRVLSLNPSFERLFGYPQLALDSFAAWGRLAQPDPAERERTLARWSEAMFAARAGEGVVPSFRAAMRDREGRLRQVDIASVAAGDRLVTFITDLTDVLAARDGLAEQEALQRAVIEESADGVALSCARDGGPPRIELWNRRMAEITGRGTAEAEGWLPRPPLGSGATLRDLELEVARPDGTRRSCLLSTSVVPGPPGEIRVLAILRDITAQRRAEEERRQLEAQAERARQLEGLGVLAGGIAHDFNNLLMAILGRTGLVRATLAAGDATSRDDLEDMETAARRAAELCRQLLAYAGRGGARVGPVDLRSLLMGMEAMLSIAIARRIGFERDYGEAPLAIEGDADQLRQVIMNLATNAAEAVGERQGRIRLGLGVVESRSEHAAAAGIVLPPGRYAVIDVSDDGPGMDTETVQRAFEPFFTSKFTGRGLGLPVAIGIVRSHRGGIDIESVPGRGTSVRVLLPLLEQAAPAAPLPAPTSPIGTVLVVDDEPSIRAITAEMLVHLGYAAREASTAQEAITAFSSAERPWAVVLDLSLPDAGGEEVLARLRALDPRTRVVVASGYGLDEVRRFVPGIASDLILTKPYDLDALATALRPGGVGPVAP